MKHLWEVDHSYYCSESNYFDNGCTHYWASWSDFLHEEGDAEIELNLVFRFDWIKADEENEHEHDLLFVFFIGQRKGIFRSAIIKIQDEDEPSVIEYLKPRMLHLFALWEPLFNPAAPEAE